MIDVIVVVDVGGAAADAVGAAAATTLFLLALSLIDFLKVPFAERCSKKLLATLVDARRRFGAGDACSAVADVDCANGKAALLPLHMAPTSSKHMTNC